MATKYSDRRWTNVERLVKAGSGYRSNIDPVYSGGCNDDFCSVGYAPSLAIPTPLTKGKICIRFADYSIPTDGFIVNMCMQKNLNTYLVFSYHDY